MFANQEFNFTLVAAGAIAQYRFVTGSSDNYGYQSSAGTQTIVGVSQNAPAAAGEHLSVCPLGLSRIQVNTAVAAFALLTATVSGGATTAASGDMVAGVALEAGAVGDLITAFINPPWKLG